MRVDLKSEQVVDDATCKARTGKSLTEWHAALDARDARAMGRREVGNWLYGELKLDPWWATTINNEYEIARGLLEKDGKPKGYTICATKSIKADAISCCAAFASAAMLDQWFGDSNAIEFKEGGGWRNADGQRATLRKINPGKTLKLMWEDETLTMPSPVEI